MADMFDYLDWFGDFDFETVPFNEVDNLILAQVSYLPLLDVVPAPGEGSVSLAEAANRYVEKFPSSAPARLGPLLSARTNDLLGHMASCGRRYADMQLGAYEEVLDEGTHEQFGAITFELPDGSIYVAFRGTDSSLEGWLEDCEISYKVIPSQTHALAYLRAVVAAAKKTDGQGQVRVTTLGRRPQPHPRGLVQRLPRFLRRGRVSRLPALHLRAHAPLYPGVQRRGLTLQSRGHAEDHPVIRRWCNGAQRSGVAGHARVLHRGQAA